MPEILIRKHHLQMEQWRREAHEKYKTKYEQLVSPFRDLLTLYCKKNNMGVVAAAIKLASHIPVQPQMVKRFGTVEKSKRHLTACFFSAALDLLDKKTEFAD